MKSLFSQNNGRAWRGAAIVLAVALLPSVGFALGPTQNWQPVNGPWISPVAIASFNDAFVVLSDTGNATVSPKLWWSQDATSWSSVIDPDIANLRFWAFAEHQEFLYGFAVDSGSRRLVFRTQDGQAWEPAGDVGIGPRWSDTKSFNGWLYATAANGESWRSQGGSPVSWNPLSFAGGGTNPELEVFNGWLYQTRIQPAPVGGTLMNNLWRSNDGLNWSLLRQETHDDGSGLFGTMVVSENHLYWAPGWMVEVTADEPPQTRLMGITTDSSQTLVSNPGIFDLEGQLHYLAPPVAFWISLPPIIWQHISNFTWNQVFTGPFVAPSTRDRANREARFRDDRFLLGSSLWVLRMGVRSLSEVLVRTRVFPRGEEKAALFAFTVRVERQDSLINLRIDNQGSARVGEDLASPLSLYRVAPGDPGADQPSEKLADLIPLGDRSWTFSGSLPIRDSDVLVVVGDINGAAIAGRTIQMAIPAGGITWNVSDASNVVGPLVGSAEHSIITDPASAAGLIENVVVAPQPARDHVSFFVGLTDTSDVEVRVFDRVAGLITTIKQSGLGAGSAVPVTWDTRNIASGVYFADVLVRDPAGERRHTAKVVIKK